MKNLKQLGILVFVFIVATGVLILASKLEKIFPGWRPELSAFWGLALGTVLLFLFKFMISHLNVQSFRIRSNIRDIAVSVGMVVAVFCISVALLHSEWQGKQEIKSSMLIENLFYQVRPSYGEEVGFRYGLANLTFGFFGVYPAIIAGSVPFGLIHLSNFKAGQPIEWDYILGVTIGGLFLTLIFMNFNLVAAVTVHYVWDFLALFFSKIFGLPQERLEGANVTLISFVVISVFLLLRLRTVGTKSFQPENDAGIRVPWIPPQGGGRKR